MFKRLMAVLDISLPAANAISSAASLALVIGTVLVLAGTVAAIWTSGIKERYANERISANEAQTATARADAEKARADAAQAHENTEILRQSNLALQTDLEHERAARLKLEGRLAPRNLSDAQKEALVTALKPFAGRSVSVAIPMGATPETNVFATEFVSVFRAAGWNTDGINQIAVSGEAIVGIQITVNETDARANKIPTGAEQLLLTLVGLGLATRTLFMNQGIQSGEIEFRVGPKL